MSFQNGGCDDYVFRYDYDKNDYMQWELRKLKTRI
jgi:hypothetical protein